MIPDNVLYECLDFLDYCEMYGKEIRARDVDPLSTEARDARNTVAYEARLLKNVLLKIIGWPWQKP